MEKGKKQKTPKRKVRFNFTAPASAQNPACVSLRNTAPPSAMKKRKRTDDKGKEPSTKADDEVRLRPSSVGGGGAATLPPRSGIGDWGKGGAELLNDDNNKRLAAALSGLQHQSFVSILCDPKADMYILDGLLHTANVTIEDAIASSIVHMYEEKAFPLDEIAQKVQVIIKNGTKYKETDSPSQSEREYREAFIGKFYRQIYLELPYSVVKEANLVHKSKVEDIDPAVFMPSDAFRYLKTACNLRDIRIDTQQRIKCRVCEQLYVKYTSLGFAYVCVPCLHRFVDYIWHDKLEAIREETKQQMMEYMAFTRATLGFEDEETTTTGKEEGSSGC